MARVGLWICGWPRNVPGSGRDWSRSSEGVLLGDGCAREKFSGPFQAPLTTVSLISALIRNLSRPFER
jgi:hypothetical protein